MDRGELLLSCDIKEFDEELQRMDIEVSNFVGTVVLTLLEPLF